MTYKLGNGSRAKLVGVHPDLVRVVERAIAITEIDFTVLEGVRTLARQKELFATGKSTTMKSRHLSGHAVDVAPWVNGTISWSWPDYYILEKAMKQAAADCGVPIEWGGDWTTFKDGPHWQLPWASYPAGVTHV